VIIDFERSLLNSVKLELKTATCFGCYFHFGQALWRRIQEDGKSCDYRRDNCFNKVVRYLILLAFVPVNNVRDAYIKIKSFIFEKQIKDLSGFLSYFEKN
jgi:hypothetical protein